VKILFVPANQHRNWYKGQGITEADWAVETAWAAHSEAVRQGHEAKTVWIKGKGTLSTDELATMMQQGIAWKPDAVLSIHSDVGSMKVPRHIYPLTAKLADNAWGRSIARNLASRVGYGVQYPTVRSGLMFFSRLRRGLPRLKWALLLEIGQHNIVADAAFNMKYHSFLGQMAARAFIQGCGVRLSDDGPVAKGTALPQGQERWKA
jgi:hypothetical protein